MIPSGQPLDIEITFRADHPGRIRECAILIYSAGGVRVGIIDVRESQSIPFEYTTGRVGIIAQIRSITLVEGVYALGLYLATDGFAGDLFDLSYFMVGASPTRKYAPYHAEVRGFVTISAAVSVTSIRQGAVECSAVT